MNGDKSDAVEVSTHEDEGELGQLKKLHATKLSTMKEMFPDWTDEDLVFALQETEGNLEQTIERISDGMNPPRLGPCNLCTVANQHHRHR